MLTTPQKQTLKAAILADQAAALLYADGDLSGLADWLNGTAAPAFKVWRSAVARAEIYNRTSDEGTNWSWTFYKNQSAVEQNAWVQMFMGDAADFSQSNLRAGIAVIFTAASAANATHALAVGKRSATRAEKALASGTGSKASPATMGFEGQVQYTDLVGL